MERRVESQKTFAENVLQDYISQPHNQRLVILIGAVNSLLVSGMTALLDVDQFLLVMDYQPAVCPMEASDQVIFSCGDTIPGFVTKLGELVVRIPVLTYRICVEQGEDPQRNKALQSMAEHVASMVHERMARESYFRESAELELHNTLLNLPLISVQNGIKSLHGVAPPEALAVVVGAGPSLSDQLEWVAQNRENLFVIAAGSTLRAMESVEIEPDLYVEIDIRSFEHWEKDRFYQHSLVCSPNISPGFAACFGQVFWFNFDDWCQRTLQQVCPEIDALRATFNTGCISAELAAYMGFARIVFLGIDLCMSPEGASHTKFHNQGKDNILGGGEDSDRFDWVENNLGEKCRTLFGKIGMIQGFENVIAAHPETRFVQASPKGIKLNGAVYTHWQDVSVPETGRLRILTQERRNPFPERLPVLSTEVDRLIRLVGEINESNCRTADPDGPGFITFFKRIAGWNSIFRESLPYEDRSPVGRETELERLKRAVVNILLDGKRIAEKASSVDQPFRAFYEEYKHAYLNRGIECDWMFELDILADCKLSRSVELRDYLVMQKKSVESRFRIAARGKNRIQLQMFNQERDRYVLAVGYYDWQEAARKLAVDHINSWVSAGRTIKDVVCIGVFDSNYLLLLRRFLPGMRIVIAEPEFELFAEILRFIPLVSLMGDYTEFLIGQPAVVVRDFLSGSGIDLAAASTGLICPDMDGRFFPVWRQYHDQLVQLRKEG